MVDLVTYVDGCRSKVKLSRLSFEMGHGGKGANRVAAKLGARW
jgi:hypothetical protein